MFRQLYCGCRVHQKANCKCGQGFGYVGVEHVVVVGVVVVVVVDGVVVGVVLE